MVWISPFSFAPSMKKILFNCHIFYLMFMNVQFKNFTKLVFGIQKLAFQIDLEPTYIIFYSKL